MPGTSKTAASSAHFQPAVRSSSHCRGKNGRDRSGLSGLFSAKLQSPYLSIRLESVLGSFTAPARHAFEQQPLPLQCFVAFA